VLSSFWLVACLALAGPSGAVTPSPPADAGLLRLEEEIDAAVEAGDFARAKQLDIELAGRRGATRDGLAADGPVFEPGRPLDAEFVPGLGVEIETGPVRAFGAGTDSTGAIWLAAALPDLSVRVYRSQDFGRNWNELFRFTNGTDVSQLEVVFGPGDSSFVYVFYLESRNAGDIRAVRVPLDTVAPVALDVVVGGDTITDFSVCADRDRFHYLYLLYANERRTGRTGGFTRSVDFGKKWELAQPWWNCTDPCVVYATGSTIHCAWRFALTGREIHLQSNRHYGRLDRWWTYRLVSGENQLCRDPAVAQADTGREWNSRVWVAYTVARRDTQELDIAFSHSGDGGWTWNEDNDLGEDRVDEFFADLVPAPGDPGGSAHLVYTAGQRSGAGKTNVRWRCANVFDPAYWSAPVTLSGQRANAGFEGCRPRVVAPAGAPHRWPGVCYSLYHPDHGDRLLFNALWLSGPPAASPGPGLRAVARGRGRVELLADGAAVSGLTVFDALGRRVRTLGPGAGRWEWDGRDEAGRPARSGTYFAALASGPRARFALVR
jgi:hypothetical protein